MWPTDYNEQFKKDWTVRDHNFDPTRFDDKAVSAFQKAVAKLFSIDENEAENLPIRYCHRAKSSSSPIYVGTVGAVTAFLQRNPAIREKMGITELTSAGFTASWVDGSEKPQAFMFPPEDTKIVLYSDTQEWQEMGACFELWAQFERSRELKLKQLGFLRAEDHGVSTYHGFTGQVSRLVFDYGSPLPEGSERPVRLRAVLAGGTGESEENLTKGRALMAYAFPQTVTEDVVSWNADLENV